MFPISLQKLGTFKSGNQYMVIDQWSSMFIDCQQFGLTQHLPEVWPVRQKKVNEHHLDKYCNIAIYWFKYISSQSLCLSKILSLYMINVRVSLKESKRKSYLNQFYWNTNGQRSVMKHFMSKATWIQT